MVVEAAAVVAMDEVMQADSEETGFKIPAAGVDDVILAQQILGPVEFHSSPY